MNDWSPFYDLSDRAAFIRVSTAFYRAMKRCPIRLANELALEDWEDIRQAMREDEQK